MKKKAKKIQPKKVATPLKTGATFGELEPGDGTLFTTGNGLVFSKIGFDTVKVVKTYAGKEAMLGRISTLPNNFVITIYNS